MSTAPPTINSALLAPRAPRSRLSQQDDSLATREDRASFEYLLKELSADSDAPGAEAFAACSVFGVGAPLEGPSSSATRPETTPPTPFNSDEMKTTAALHSPSPHPNCHTDKASLAVDGETLHVATSGNFQFQTAEGATAAASVSSARGGSARSRTSKIATAPGEVADPVGLPNRKSAVPDATTESLEAVARMTEPRAARLASAANSSRVLVTLHALETGVRVYARIGAMAPQERERLRLSIRALLAEHGLPNPEITFDTLENASETPHGGGA